MIYLKNDRLPKVDIQIIFKNAGKNTSHKAGLSYIVSKILSSGTMKKDESEFYENLESRAIYFGVHSGYENITFSLSSLSEETSKGIKALKSVLNKPRLTKKNLSKIIKEIKGNILEKQNNFDYLASVGLNKIMFKGSNLAKPLIGDLKSIKNIKLNDIKTFIKSHITLNNITIIIAGDYNDKDIKGIKKALFTLNKGKKEKEKIFSIEDKNETIKQNASTKQAYINFGSSFNLKVNDSDYYKAKIAHFILGSGGFGSRLMNEIRVKKGLAYSAYSDIQIEKTFSDFRGSLQTKLENETEAIKIVKETILKFTQKGVSQKELNSARKFILGSYPLKNELLNQRISRMFSDFNNNKKENSYEENLKKIKQLSLRELNIFIKKHTEINNLSFYIITKKIGKK
jgi:predicted Zn-dependent peptidase